MIKKTSLLCWLFCLFLSFHIHAQISGCTDPQASNYDPGATINDGSCLYNTVTVTPVTSAILPGALSETSGLVLWNNYLWTHNDNADTSIYAVDTLTAGIVQTLRIPGVLNTDWEDIAQDSAFIYIGDFGNNANGNRTDLRILRISKSSILLNSPIADTINFSYSDQTDLSPAGANNTDFDCEAFVVSSDSIFLFTKQWVSQKTCVYGISKEPGTYSAHAKSCYDVSGLISGATFLENKKLLVLCGYSKLLQPFIYLLYDFTGTDFFSGNKRKMSVALSFHQTEGIATANGIKFYLSNEYFTQPPFVTNEQELHTLDLSPYLGLYLNYSNLEISNQVKENGVLIYPNPARDFIIVRSGSGILPLNYTISDTSGRIIISGSLQAETVKINVRKLASGLYHFAAGGTIRQNFQVIRDN